MTSRFYTVPFLLCCYFVGFGQDTIDHKEKKCQFLFQLGISYKGFFGGTYIEPAPAYGYNGVPEQFDRFTKLPTPGFDIGGLWSLKIARHWKFSTGLTYCLRKDRYENDQDTVLKYGNVMNRRDIRNVVQYDYRYNNLEIPLMFQYTLKRFSVFAGFKFALLSLRKASYTYLIETAPGSYKYTHAYKSLTEWELPFKIYPAIRMSYAFNLKNLTIMPFLGIDVCEINFSDFNLHIYTNPSIWIDSYGPEIENCFFLQAGIIIPVLINKK